MNIQKIPAAEFNPAAQNPRKNLKPGDKEYEKLKRSITTNTSGYIGVSFSPRLGCYEAYIHFNGTKHHLGLYADPATAAMVRDCVARLLFGEFARLNFPGKAGRRYGAR